MGTMMDAAATSPNAETVPVPVLAQETLHAVKERLHSTSERVEMRISTIHTRTHRFPRRLRGIGGAGDDSYVVPSVVAIGPYHHGLPHLLEMEDVKQAAAHRLCRDSGHTVEEVYGKVFSIAGDARRCYGDDVSLAAVSDADFATMMFLDGCFLVWYIAATSLSDRDDALERSCSHSSGPNIMKDIFLLENQIPWVVLEALMEFRPLRRLKSWIDSRVKILLYREKKKVRPWIVQRSILLLMMRCRRVLWKQRDTTAVDVERSIHSYDGDGDYSNPPHLLGLLRSRTIRSMPSQKRRGEAGNKMPLSIMPRGAVYLAQIGIKITPNRAEWFADMNVKEKLVSGELSLSPLLLGHVNACSLVNMAALEATGAFATTNAGPQSSDGSVISSYLSTMAMLMNREEDVHELRRKGVLSSTSSDAETLAFFKGVGQHVRLGYNYFNTLGEIEGYIRRRPVRIALHKFVYNNYRIIAAVLSVAGVLVSILKALYSLKKT